MLLVISTETSKTSRCLWKTGSCATWASELESLSRTVHLVCHSLLSGPDFARTLHILCELITAYIAVRCAGFLLDHSKTVFFKAYESTQICMRYTNVRTGMIEADSEWTSGGCKVVGPLWNITEWNISFLSLMSHRACCHTCYTIQLMHYSHFNTQSLQHLKPIKC